VIAIDPLLADSHVGLAQVIIVIVRVLVAFALLLVSVLFMIWFERKVIADMQDRVGPNRAGPWGLLQSMADGIKLFFKEDLLPDKADRFVFKLAPYLSVVPAFLIFTIVPIGADVTLFHHTFELQVADPPMGILLLLALSSISVYGVMLAGWASGSKYPLVGSVRASAQMISYEAAISLSIVAVILVSVIPNNIYTSLSTQDIVFSQSPHVWDWNIIRTGILPFFIFMIAITAEVNRPPFDLVEAEQELVGGFHTEYSSIRFALFYLAEYMNTITMSAVAVTLFFGGPDGPKFHFLTFLWPILWFAGKTLIFLFCYVWVRAALPRLRYDQLMDLGWKVLIPASLGWTLLVAASRVSHTYYVVALWFLGLLIGALIVWMLLDRAIKVGNLRVNKEVGSGVSTGRLRVSEDLLASRELVDIDTLRSESSDG
jgi:NADH-quinone oxidoreductase subunit H